MNEAAVKNRFVIPISQAYCNRKMSIPLMLFSTIRGILMATALGIEMVQRGYKVKFITASSLKSLTNSFITNKVYIVFINALGTTNSARN